MNIHIWLLQDSHQDIELVAYVKDKEGSLHTTVSGKIQEMEQDGGRSLKITELAEIPNHDKGSHPWTVQHHASWCPKGSLKKFIETFSWHFYAGKLKTEQKVIILPCLHSPPYLFSRKICTQSHSAKILNWGDHANLVPDLAASPPAAEHHANMGRKTHVCRFFFFLNPNKFFCDF